MNYSAVIVASGQGTRMNLGFNKVYAKIGDKTILERTIDLFKEDENCRQIVVVTQIATFAKELSLFSGKIVLVEGGATRQKSVLNGLMAVTEPVVLIHDGARCFCSHEAVTRLLEDMKQYDASILAIPVKDTIKVVQDEMIVDTPNRATLWQAQTPQAFKTGAILRYSLQAEEDGFSATDDASIMEKYSENGVHIILGEEENIKITTPSDLKRFEQ